jgi:hypothetical protein
MVELRSDREIWACLQETNTQSKWSKSTCDGWGLCELRNFFRLQTTQIDQHATVEVCWPAPGWLGFTQPARKPIFINSHNMSEYIQTVCICIRVVRSRYEWILTYIPMNYYLIKPKTQKDLVIAFYFLCFI